jgi:hypothetical protein
MKFKPEDFNKLDNMPFGESLGVKKAEIACILANKKLKEWLKDAPVVYCARGYGHVDSWKEDDGILDADASHKARLVCIEEIE